MAGLADLAPAAREDAGVTGQPTAEAVATTVVEAFGAADFERMRSVLADDLRAYITNGAGGADEARRGSGYLDRVAATDLPSSLSSASRSRNW